MSDLTTATRCLSERDFPVPVTDRWFEDYHPGSVYEYGHVVPSAESILDFARQYDPQPIHTDPAYAQTGPFGGLIASGWHTAALAMRLFVEHYVSHVASMASPGMDELRWPKPVRPGDVLRGRVTVQAARVTRSNPRRGLVHSLLEMVDQDDDVVMSAKAMNFLARRPDQQPG